MAVELAFLLGISGLIVLLGLLDLGCKFLFNRKQLIAWWNSAYISHPSLPDHLECKVDYQGFPTTIRWNPQKLRDKIREDSKKFEELEKTLKSLK
ncbi:hypothetical protein VP501E541_P0039 [Vibrio phage 501E54-1]|nr:hypothetical protein VP501E541_P0039 [Vibrio phage 501E54-1]